MRNKHGKTKTRDIREDLNSHSDPTMSARPIQQSSGGSHTAEKPTQTNERTPVSFFGRLAKEPPSQLVIASLTAILAISTVIYVLVTNRHLDTAREAITFSKEAFLAGNRAYICVKDSEVFRATRIGSDQAKIGAKHEALVAGDIAALEVTFINSGATPANKVASTAFIHLIGSWIPDEDPQHEPSGGIRLDASQSIDAVPKDGTFTIAGTTFAELSQDEVARINAGKTFLVIYGRVTYEDMFKVSHRTTFCRAYLPRKPDLAPCPTFNRIE